MSTTPHDGADFDVTAFDLDAWIDDIERPSVVVELYPFEAQYQDEVAKIEAQIQAAEKAGDEDRGLDEETASTLLARLDEMRRERSERALRVRVRQLIDADIVKAVKAAKKANASEDEVGLWTIAAATVHPDYDGPLSADEVPQHFTARQLYKMGHRDRSGAAMVAQLAAAANSLVVGPPVPSSPER